MPKTAPLICEVTRGTMVESVHRVHAMMIASDGTETIWGDPDLLFYPRSAIKSLQALPLIESGAADAVNASSIELALAAASHSSGPDHVAAVNAWLARLGLDEDALKCGPHLPYDEHAAHDMVRAGAAVTRAHNNCSGKHTGFLCTAQHLGEPLDDYLDPEHPVQRRLFDILTTFGGESLETSARGSDGCGIPVYGMSLRGLATAAQRMAAPKNVSDTRGHAIRRILRATMQEPYYVGGRERFDTDVMRAMKGAVATKGGAEGVHIAMIPQKGIGIALKTEDGNKRGGDVAMGWLLTRAGVISDEAKQALKNHLAPTLYNTCEEAIGTVRVRI